MSAPLAAEARDVRGELEAARHFGREMADLVAGRQNALHWPEEGTALVYRIDAGPQASRWMAVDLATGAKGPAFDHAALAKALAAAAGRKVAAEALPLENPTLDTRSRELKFRAFGQAWRYRAGEGVVARDDGPPPVAALVAPSQVLAGTRQHGPAATLIIENTRDDEIGLYWIEGNRNRKSYGRIPPGERREMGTYAGHRWLFTSAQGEPIGGIEAGEGVTVATVGEPVAEPPPPPRHDSAVSPDGKFRAVVRNHNLALVPVAGGEPEALTTDGDAAWFYEGPFHWSPDSTRLVARRTKPVEERKVRIVQSSPPDQVQPKLKTLNYPKPGDPIRQSQPRLFDIANRRPIPTDDALFENPWNIGEGAWNKDGSEYSFVYNQRGHQVLRIVALRAADGAARVIHEETSATFIDYSQKSWLHRLPEAGHILWASERSGHNHIYRIDEAAGRILNPVTQGDWNVRRVVEVDEERQRLLLQINGQPGSDPYHHHFAWVNFDGSGLVRLTESDGNHATRFSPCRKFVIATWSRVDHPPVVELRRADDGALVTELARADDSALVVRGWQRPERFVAKGRDGRTDIHGVIVRPPGFDPARQYPVLEHIYAGPHSFFTPKEFFTHNLLTEMAGLGFVVVQMDGMGTNWRNRAFHDVAWKNLADSGFPDRIAWLKAAAATRPWMDLSRVGIFGGSAGGQSTLAGLLHHGDFYRAGVADCGCHDNRMDKIWWNEAWMGWPVDESYARSSNVTHAAKLRGKLMLIVGELDENVDPASTSQVVHALQQAGKDFDFVPIMNAGHGAAETPYGKFRRAAFLTRHLRPEPVKAW